ncbi:MAG: hypothetical protein GKS00_27005 [Alphaproteobacteria bacterium]|nr:hypothetical protein [Alphaproteobacteria bacterium]
MNTALIRKGFFGAVFAAITAIGLTQPANAAGNANIVNLTQTACQFVETEGVDHGFTSNAKADCEEINDRSGDERLAKSQVLKLKPGQYTFRVTNKNVPYELGFWLRGSGVVGRVSLPSVSGGGLATGVTKDYTVTLKPGEYLYSCPLNPTPNYKIIVEG